MDQDEKNLLKTLASVSSIGISVVLAIGMGVWAGLKLDEWLGTKPWFFYIFLFIGIAAGFKNVFVLAGRAMDKKNGNGKNGN
jgi:ATP synthase protein I